MSNDYCETADVEARFGPNNVEKWADLDNDGDATKIAARIAAAIDYASDYIDDYLRGSHYTIPLKTPAWCNAFHDHRSGRAELAGVWLYECRGIEDFTPDGKPFHRLSPLKKSVRSELEAVRTQVRVINAV